MSGENAQKEYTVTWAIEVTAESPRKAAEAALAIMLDPGEALFFKVADGMTDAKKNLLWVNVDLNVKE